MSKWLITLKIDRCGTVDGSLFNKRANESRRSRRKKEENGLKNKTEEEEEEGRMCRFLATTTTTSYVRRWCTIVPYQIDHRHVN